jgi:hypothetical protein
LLVNAQSAIAVDVLLKMNYGWFQAYQSKSFVNEYYPESFILFILGVLRYPVTEDTIVSQFTETPKQIDLNEQP